MKTSHQTFILEMVKHGDKELAWQKANPGNKGGNSARKAADRLLRRHPEMAAEIEEAVATIRQQAYTEAYRLYTEQQRTPLLSMMQRREVLARIARCEVKVCRYVKDGDSYRMLFEDPRPRDMIRAIETDAKLEEACNRARNFTDPVLSQFNIYIDGRPCDDPAAPVNTDLPPGIVMLPRKAKKLLPEASAENTENGNTSATLGLSIPTQEKNIIENGNPVRTGATLSTAAYPDPIHPQSPLYPNYLNVLEQRKLSEEDLLHASLYSQHKRAEAEAPPPHVLTNEEIAEMERALAREQRHTLAQPHYCTFGKMYFPEKDTLCSL